MKKFVEKEPNELEPTNLPATQAPARGRQSPVGQGPHHAGVMRPCRRLAEPSPPNRGARGRSCACAGRGSTGRETGDLRAQHGTHEPNEMGVVGRPNGPLGCGLRPRGWPRAEQHPFERLLVVFGDGLTSQTAFVLNT